MPPSRTGDTFLASYSRDVQALASAARRLVRKALPGVEERVDQSAPVIGYGYGAGYKGMMCTLIVSKAEVKLGLVRGAELPDPDRLLEGSGKVHRYVRLRTPADIARPAVTKLIKATYAGWQRRSGQL